MITFTWDDQQFELVQRPLVAELRALRKWLGDDADTFDNVIGTIAISIKRARPGFDLRAVDAWEAEDLIGISNQLEAQSTATATDGEAPAPADAEDAEPAVYAGLSDEQVPPTGGGSALNVQPPQESPAPVNA